MKVVTLMFQMCCGAGIPDTDPCSLLFMGTEPESEIEVKNVARFVEQGSFSAFLTYHSYSQFFLTRWDYDSILPSDHAVLVSIPLFHSLHRTAHF